MTLEEQAATMNQEAIVALLVLNQTYQFENKKLGEQLAWLKRQMFGKKSERSVPEIAAEQGRLFEVKSSALAERSTEIRAHTRKKRPALSQGEDEAEEGTFPEHLRREDIPIQYKPEGYGDDELEVLGEKVTERLAEKPGEQYVKRYVRTTYKVKASGDLLCAPAPEHLFGRCKVDEGFVVLMAVRKFMWHLPLYRQHQMLKLEGVELSRESFANWMIKLSELFSPIAQAIRNELWKQEYLHVDNSPGIVGRGNKKWGKSFDQGYFWPLFNPNIGVYFEFSRDKSYRSFETIISGYKGKLVSDAEEIFEKYVTAHELCWQLCWMHIRRNFFDAEKSTPALAEEALQYIRALYRVEREIKEKRISVPEKVSKYRVKNSAPVLEQFRAWLRKTSATPEAITDELLSKAINYVLSRWEAAVLYISEGALPMDNGADEREIRPLKLGFKNYLFCASEVGAKAAAIFYTLIHSAKLHGIHPYYYLLDLCKRINQAGLSTADLLPHTWKTKFFNEAVPEHARYVLQK